MQKLKCKLGKHDLYTYTGYATEQGLGGGDVTVWYVQLRCKACPWKERLV